MMRHIVLFRRQLNVLADPKLEQALVERMDALGKQIPGIRNWIFRKNEVARPICWDYVLDSAVDDVKALNDYLFHPLHQALVADLKVYFEWVAVDYTV